MKDKHGHLLYPCQNKCGAMIRRDGGLCSKCYNIQLHKRAEIKQVEINERKQAKLNPLYKMFKSLLVEVCLNSPTNRHYWLIDSNNIGKCKFCHIERDYKAKLEKYIPVIVALGK